MEYTPRSYSNHNANRHLSPLLRVYRRNNYMPISKNVKEFKGILKKFMFSKGGEILENENRLVSKQSKSAEKMRISNIKKIYKKKNFDPVQKNELSITAKKLTFSRTMRKMTRSKLKNLEENSNYTSYSNIYKSLVEKIPLILKY